MKRNAPKKAAMHKVCQGRSSAALRRAAARTVRGRRAVSHQGIVLSRPVATLASDDDSNFITPPALVPGDTTTEIENEFETYEVFNIKTGKSIHVSAISMSEAIDLAIEARLARKRENLKADWVPAQ